MILSLEHCSWGGETVPNPLVQMPALVKGGRWRGCSRADRFAKLWIGVKTGLENRPLKNGSESDNWGRRETAWGAEEMGQRRRERIAWGTPRRSGRRPWKQKGRVQGGLDAGESEEGRLTAGMSGQSPECQAKSLRSVLPEHERVLSLGVTWARQGKTKAKEEKKYEKPNFKGCNLFRISSVGKKAAVTVTACWTIPTFSTKQTAITRSFLLVFIFLLGYSRFTMLS